MNSSVVFPVPYILGDALTEVYGYAVTRRVIWTGSACNLLVVAAILAGQELPAAGFWQDQETYETILGYTPRLLAASFAAYLAREFANAAVLSRLKLATNGRVLWLRTVSLLVGQGLDSAIFISIASPGPSPATRSSPWPGTSGSSRSATRSSPRR